MSNQGKESRAGFFESEEPVEWARKISSATTTGGFQAVDLTYTEHYPGAGTFIKSQGKCSEQLSVFRQARSKWQQSFYQAGKTSIRIGSAREKCDIAIEDDADVDPIHTTIIYLGEMIFIIERGSKGITLVNGVRTPSALLDDRSPAILAVGRTSFILRPKRSIPDKGRKMESSFSLKTKSGQQQAEFGRCNLVGSHGACDLKVEGPEFAGMILPHANNLYFTPLEAAACNGTELPMLQPCHLPPGSSLDTFNATVDIPAGLTDGNVFDFRPQVPASLKFTEILDIEQQGPIRMRLPPSGSSFMVSRKKTSDCFYIASECISRQHAQVIVYDKSIMVEDLGSKNGTFINGERIKRKLAYPGDFLSMGDRTFLLGYSVKDEF